MPKRTKKLRKIVARIDRIIEEYNKETITAKRDYQTYEREFALRVKYAFNQLSPLIKEAIAPITQIKSGNRGNKPKLNLEQKVMLILLQRICIKSNRCMSYMLVLFHCFTGIETSYKIIERLYSDIGVRLALYNMHILLLKKKGITEIDGAGDGTGYTVLINEHYATEAKKRKEKAKEIDKKQKKHNFIYSFALMDVNTRMYVGYGTSLKSEKEAFEAALKLTKNMPVTVCSLRLDKYYSGESYVNLCQENLGKVKMYILPKSNIAKFGLGEWCSMLYRFLNNVKLFLKEYFQRNQSESGFSEDKKRTGWRISQKRPDRIDTAYFVDVIWHNLYWGCPDV